jgi:hypothetical protein
MKKIVVHRTRRDGDRCGWQLLTLSERDHGAPDGGCEYRQQENGQGAAREMNSIALLGWWLGADRVFDYAGQK